MKKGEKSSKTEHEESEKANKVAHILRSRESEHSIRKVYIRARFRLLPKRVQPLLYNFITSRFNI